MLFTVVYIFSSIYVLNRYIYVVLDTVLRTGFQGTIIMQTSVLLFAYCSGREFYWYYTDLPIISKYGTGYLQKLFKTLNIIHLSCR